MRCSQITITWYPGEVGTTDDPLVLLSTSHYVPGPGALAGLMEQIVQSESGHRWESGVNFARGNVRAPLSIQEWRKFDDPLEAHETGLALMAGLPTVVGWLLIEIESRDTTWSIASAAIRNVIYEVDEAQRYLNLTWTVDGGALAVYAGEDPPGVYPYGEIILGPGTTNRGALLLGPNRTYPAP